MSAWVLFQVVINISFALALVVFWLRLKRPPQDDPRLSRGLQLLQSKLSVLEDLADRTDQQAKHLTALLDHKTRQIQTKIMEAEQQTQKIAHAMNRSLEVAEIFQDKIPHQEIIERQNTAKYINAAQLAHAGQSVEAIAQQVDLPKEQIELIAKFNREQLLFQADKLPAWALRSPSTPIKATDIPPTVIEMPADRSTSG